MEVEVPLVPMARFAVDGWSHGLAVCPQLDVIIGAPQTRRNCLVAWRLSTLFEEAVGGSALEISCVDLGDVITSAAFFIPPWGTVPLLLVCNYNRHAVHMVDVLSGSCMGYVAHSEKIRCPVGVAASMGLRGPSSLIAVSHNVNQVSLYAWSRTTGGPENWDMVRTIRWYDNSSFQGLRFSGDGALLCVSCTYNCLYIFETKKGKLVKKLNTRSPAVDVEECRNGWISVGRFGQVEFVSMDHREENRILANTAPAHVAAAALVPGVGIALRHSGCVILYVKITPMRDAWMVAAARSSYKK